jgi:GDP-D-mannose dehydratase
MLLGEAAKARRDLGWANKTSFRGLVAEMVAADLQAHKYSPANAVAG